MKNLIMVLMLVCSLVYAKGDLFKDEESIDDTSTEIVVVESRQKKVKDEVILGVGLYYSIFNSYKRGNVDNWFQYMAQDNSRKADSGSPAMYGGDLSISQWFSEDTTIGFGLGFFIGNSHGIWGTKLSYGGRTEMYLQPSFVNFNIPIKSRLGDSDLFLLIEPSLVAAWVTGKLTRGREVYNFTPAPGFGAQLAIGAEWMLTDNIGAAMKVGYRAVKTKLCYPNSKSATGYSQPAVDSKGVEVDLSGSFGIVGIVFHF